MEHRPLASDLIIPNDGNACGNKLAGKLAPDVAQEELLEEKQIGVAVNCSNSELSIYLQALEEGFLPTFYSGTSQSAQSKSMSIASKSFQRGRKTVVFHGFQSLQMSRNSTESHGEGLSILSLGGSPARTSAPQEKEPGLQESAADSGWKWRESSVKYDPAMRLWKTRQCSLFEGSELFSETWPRWGFVVPGVSLEPLTLERHISERESGSSENQSHEQDAGIHQAVSGILLSAVWSGDGKTAFLKWQTGRLGTLYEAEILLEEMPGRITHKEHRNGRPIQIPSKDTAGRLLRALQICDQFTGSPQGQEFVQQHAREFADTLRKLSQHIALAGAEGEWIVNLEWRASERPMSERPTFERGSGSLPTPRVAADRTSRTALTAKHWSAPSLWQAVELLEGILPRELRAETEMNSSCLALWKKSVKGEAHGPLNVEFLEWLMGWPLGWTELKPLETDKSRNALL